jgi:hypothetical protein
VACASFDEDPTRSRNVAISPLSDPTTSTIR